MSAPYDRVTCLPVTGVGEVRAGDDLAALLAAAAPLRDGDVLVVTSKVVSKAEGRVVTAPKEEALAGETDRVVAVRGGTSIVRTHHGLVMAAAGIDASNTEPGTLVLLPADPDASARALRERMARDGGPNVAVLVTDTAGRAWRNGQTDIAVGAAGIEVLEDHAGREDGYGNVLAVTAPALADEVAGAADLVKGKLRRAPAAVVRGLAALVLPPGEHGPGAAALVRDEAHDMFGLGAREAVLHAVRRREPRGFGAPSPAQTLAGALADGLAGAAAGEPRSDVVVADDGTAVTVDLPGATDAASARALGRLEERATTVAYAHGWHAAGAVPHVADATGARVVLRFVAATP